MKKIIVFVLILSLAMISLPAYAAKGRKGASDRALERASDEAVFHRVSDWFSTIGKSKEEKDSIIAERQIKREAERAKKEAEKAARKAEKEAKKKAEEVKEKAEKKKKSMKKSLDQIGR